MVQGNFIGTDVTGSAAVPNASHGVFINFGSANNTIGGTTLAARNLISGNGGNGVRSDYHPNAVQGNFIGTQADGVSPLGNGLNGVLINFTVDNTIGGSASGAGNTIAFNGGAGVLIMGVTSNPVSSNAVFANAGIGIDLDGNGITPNDPCDGDSGANKRQNTPVITSSSSSSSGTAIQGTLDSAPNVTFKIEFFANSACDSSGHGEGEQLIGSTTVTTDGGCHASFAITLPIAVPSGSYITATATDPNGNTSEFAQCSLVATASPELRLTTAVSRKTHGSAGTFDLPLPFSSPFGVECRSGSGGGNHSLVFTFTNSIVSGSASVTTGTGSVSGGSVVAGNTMTVNLTGVTDAQLVGVTLSNVTDTFAQVLPSTLVSAKILLGDVNESSSVNATDIGQTKSQTGTTTGIGNFRTDVNVSGSINSGDIGQVKANSGHSVP